MYNIKLANPSIIDQDIEYTVLDVLHFGRFIKGEYNKKFAEAWAKYCGAEYCVPMASGTAALIATLRALRPGTVIDRPYVIVPEYSFAATALAVYHAGCVPVYCKILGNGLIDQDHCLELLEKYNISMVIIVHLYGQRVEIRKEIIEKVPVIEDACQAHGIIRDVQGTAACFSFYPSKNLGAAGDAGAVVTNIKGLAHWIEAYANYGSADKVYFSIMGNNLRMDEMQAAILLRKLEKHYLDTENAIRREQVVQYMESGITSIAKVEDNAWHLFPILVDNRDKVKEEFTSCGIEVGEHYPYNLADIVVGVTKTYPSPATELEEHIITLPIGSHLKNGDIDIIISKCNDLIGSKVKVWFSEDA